MNRMRPTSAPVVVGVTAAGVVVIWRRCRASGDVACCMIWRESGTQELSSFQGVRVREMRMR